MNRYFKNICTRMPLLVGAIAGFLLTAAMQVQASQTSNSETSTPTTAKDVKQEWAEALDAIKGYSVSQRDAALAKAESLLASMDSQIEALEAKAQNEWKDLGQEARAKRQAALKTLRRQRAELSEWYGGMKHSSSKAWDEVRSGFVDAYDTLGNSFTDAASQF